MPRDDESNKNGYKSPPKPVTLDAPGLINPDDFELPRRNKTRGNTSLPEEDYGRLKRVSDDDDRDEEDYNTAQRPYGQNRPEPRENRDRDDRDPRRRNPSSKRPSGRRPPPPPPRRPQRRQNPAFEISPKVKTYTILGIIIATVITIVTLILVQVMATNSLAVYLDDRFVAYVGIIDPEMTSDRFHNMAVGQLEHSLGAEVNALERVTIRQARAPAGEIILPSMLWSILNTPTYGFTFEIAAADIYVNGVREATLRGMTEAQHLERMLREDFYTQYTQRSEFVEDWIVEPRFIDPNSTEYVDAMTAFRRLSRTVQVVEPHIVQSGDTLSGLSLRYETSIQQIVRDTVGVYYDTILSVGQPLMIQKSRPLLSVRTFDYINVVQEIPMPVESIHNPALGPAVTNTIQNGRPGQEYARTRVTYENRVEVYRETLESLVIHEPVVHIVEMGSLPPETGE